MRPGCASCKGLYTSDVDLYAYVGGDPTNRTDPSGEYECSPNPDGSQTCVAHGLIDLAVLHIWAWWNGKSVVAMGSGSGGGDSSSSDTPPPVPAVSTPATPPPTGQEPDDPNRSRDRNGEDDSRSRPADEEAQNLEKQLGSEEGSAELQNGGGRAMNGAGTDSPIKDINRIVSEYGGKPGDWSKVTSTNSGHIQVHAYKNVVTGQVVELKSMIP